MTFTRRSVLKATLAALPAHCGARDFGDRGRLPLPVPVDAARAFLANQVRLLPGSPFYVRQALHRKGVLASYDPDKLLYHYRALASCPRRQASTAATTAGTVNLSVAT